MDSDEEEEDETDNDHPASDPDFGETRRAVRHRLVDGHLLCRFINEKILLLVLVVVEGIVL